MASKPEPTHDPHHPGNGPAHHTGKLCIEKGCTNPAGTAWSPYWCQQHNAERMEHIDQSLQELKNLLDHE